MACWENKIVFFQKARKTFSFALIFIISNASANNEMSFCIIQEHHEQIENGIGEMKFCVFEGKSKNRKIVERERERKRKLNSYQWSSHEIMSDSLRKFFPLSLSLSEKPRENPGKLFFLFYCTHSCHQTLCSRANCCLRISFMSRRSFSLAKLVMKKIVSRFSCSRWVFLIEKLAKNAFPIDMKNIIRPREPLHRVSFTRRVIR